METQIEQAVTRWLRTIVREEVRAALSAAEAPRNGNVVPDAYLSVAKAARLADVAPGTIRAWIRAGRLEARRAGRVLRVSRGELESFLATGMSTKARSRVTQRAKEFLSAA